MKLQLSRIFVATCAACLAQASLAAPIIVDGNMADWGLHANGTAANWTPNAGILYIVEDQSNANSGYLSPGWGGQAYDAEALYLTWGNNAQGVMSLFLALVTGHNPNTATAPGNNTFGRGDFAIDFGRDGSWDFGVLTKNRTQGLHTGDVVKTSNADWAKGLWSSPGVLANTSHPSPYVTHVNTGTDVGNAKVVWNQISGGMGILGGNHWFYEVEIPVSAFGSYWSGNNPAKSFDVQWTMDCANDIITLDPPIKVPEPASAALLLAGIGALAGQRRRKTKHN